MWRLKQFIPKEQSGLEGKTVDVGSLKVKVRSIIAQGGFSSVYLAKDAQLGKQYALKHIICNDSESLDLVKKEVSVMETLRGHPNVVTLHAQAMYDLGCNKECFLVMDYCEKMLVNVLDSRGAAYFEEKQLLLMFRDICNAVYAMHCQNPPIAHRDLKAENVLLGGDGHWKLCDFGSTSTNHKRFERADEMGIEEDIIRQQTTPAYRAPEMWDLYRREMISEKVDIWALGCLLYRMAYLKNAFDGESKLQILNGNYRIPDLPKYSTTIMSLIKDMLNASPESRPDVFQVWSRVNDCLPSEFMNAAPDRSPSMWKLQSHNLETSDSLQSMHSTAVPSRAPPPPPQKDMGQSSLPQVPREARHQTPPVIRDSDQHPQHKTGSNAPMGAFWSTKYAQEVQLHDRTKSGSDKGGDNANPPMHISKSVNAHVKHIGASPPEDHHSFAGQVFKNSGMTHLMTKGDVSFHHAGGRAFDDPSFDGCEMVPEDEKVDCNDICRTNELRRNPQKAACIGAGGHSTDEVFSAFVAEFQGSVNFPNKNRNMRNENLQMGSEKLRVDMNQLPEAGKLKVDLDQALKEKTELAYRYEKLTAICRSQRQEIQNLKSALLAAKNQNCVMLGQNVVSGSQTTSVQSSHLRIPQRQRQSTPPGRGWQVASKSEKQGESTWDVQDGLPLDSNQEKQISEVQMWQEVTGAASQLSPKQSAFNMQSPFQGSIGINRKVGSPKFDSPNYDSPKFDSPREGIVNENRRQQHTRASSIAGCDTWGFVQDSFVSVDNALQASKISGQSSSHVDSFVNSTPMDDSNNPKVANLVSKPANRSQPAGWAAF